MHTTVMVVHGGRSKCSRRAFVHYLKTKPIDPESMRAGMCDWKAELGEALGEGYEVLLPRFPTADNARYADWKLWFERITPVLAGPLVLVGHSLGGIFLVKYLSEEVFPRHIKGIFIVSAPLHSTEEEDLTEGVFTVPDDIGPLLKATSAVYFYHSKDDPVVPYADFEEYRKRLPGAHFISLQGRGHCNVPHFPELVADIRTLGRS